MTDDNALGRDATVNPEQPLAIDGGDPLRVAHHAACDLARSLHNAIREREAGPTLAQRLHITQFELQRRDDLVAELRQQLAISNRTIDRLRRDAPTGDAPTTASPTIPGGLRLAVRTVLSEHLPTKKDYAAGLKICGCEHQVAIGDQEARTRHLEDVLVERLGHRAVADRVEHDEDCPPGDRCETCGGCDCPDSDERTCPGPASSPEGCLSIDAAQQWRDEMGGGDDA